MVACQPTVMYLDELFSYVCMFIASAGMTTVVSADTWPNKCFGLQIQNAKVTVNSRGRIARMP
jgi:hypothetical protein